MPDPTTFAARLLKWHAAHGRHDLPWQLDRTPYRVWLSEIMLQQTQAATVRPYFARFTERFPTLNDLATAHDDDVMAHWSGLGYYSRARNLHRAAQLCVSEFDGSIPRDVNALLTLPGVGRSTAGAIMAQAFGEPFAILDGNVKRVLSRYLGIAEWPGSAGAQRAMWAFAEQAVPDTDVANYTQAQMDLGSLVCKPRNPQCSACPLRGDCIAFNQDLIANIPARKPKRERPTREAFAAVLMQGNAVLLIKRPPAGIWASLWTLPQADTLDELTAQIGQWVDIKVGRAMSQIDHAFSHFDLQLTPVDYGQVQLRDALNDSQVRWVDRSMLLALGIPAPIRTLLTHTILDTSS